jgi:E3 ubiquitin-protein ligase UBR1
MVEEVFYVLTTILSENGNAGGMSVPKTIRREIVHALAMGPCSFSDLVKRVAERLVDDVASEGCLKEAGTFRPPEGPTETGLYELREEAYGGWARFSTIIPGTEGKRRTLLRNRIKKKTGKKQWEIVLERKGFGVKGGPFNDLTYLSNVWEQEVIVQVVFFAIWNVLVVTDAASTLP